MLNYHSLTLNGHIEVKGLIGHIEFKEYKNLFKTYVIHRQKPFGDLMLKEIFK